MILDLTTWSIGRLLFEYTQSSDPTASRIRAEIERRCREHTNAEVLRFIADGIESGQPGSLESAAHNLRVTADYLQHLDDRALLAQMAATIYASPDAQYISEAVAMARALLAEIDKDTP